MGVALIAETLKGAFCRGDLEVATGWSSQPTAPTQVRSIQGTNTTSPQHIPGTLHTPDITAEFPDDRRICDAWTLDAARRHRQQHNTTTKGEACRRTAPRPSTTNTNSSTANQHGHAVLNARHKVGARIFPTTTKAYRAHLQPADSSYAISAPKRRLTSKL
ncbi:hypothetical protein MTO96_023854 [Rhipicephalus appendiculatus]